jgi:hemoglobin-like flavoprotein
MTRAAHRLTPLQIRLVRAHWALIEPRREGFARLFYERLFDRTPQLRSMFGNNLQAHGAKLTATLNVVVVHLDQLDPLLDTIRQLGARHLEWHVTREQYDLVGDALQWALARTLAERFTPRAALAWRRAYDAVATPMKDAAYPAPPAAAVTRPSTPRRPPARPRRRSRSSPPSSARRASS